MNQSSVSSEQENSARLADGAGDQDVSAQVVQLSEIQILLTLENGAVEERGLLPYSSNHSFLVVVSDSDLALPAVYKPQRGESPLWDFEWGTLCKREAAAYLLSQALGWQLVPPTVLRDGTRGLGSIQFFVANDTDAHYFTVRDDVRFIDTLRRLVLFDYLINNADRKSGHCLVGDDGRMWAIDHGICFHTEYKLRSVVWEFSGQPIEDSLHADIVDLQSALDDRTSQLYGEISRLLSRDEFTALRRRTERLIMTDCYPRPLTQRRNYPWPPI